MKFRANFLSCVENSSWSSNNDPRNPKRKFSFLPFFGTKSPRYNYKIYTFRFSRFLTFFSTSKSTCFMGSAASGGALFSGFVEAEGISTGNNSNVNSRVFLFRKMALQLLVWAIPKNVNNSPKILNFLKNWNFFSEIGLTAWKIIQ